MLKRLNAILWMVALTTLGLMEFGTYPNYRDGYGRTELSYTANLLYESSSRIVWSLGLAYVVYACCTSRGGLIDRFLSAQVWVPLSRLTFTAYLFQFVIILTYYYNQGMHVTSLNY